LNATLPGPAAEPGADEQTAYRQARQTLDSGDYVGGAAALQAYLQQYPASPRAPEANYWLGRTLALRSMHAEAASAYARSLKGWPQTAWAGDAVVRLSSSLVELKRNPDACKALDEYSARYSAKATPALQSRVRDVRAAAACG
jgi:tol-pal system protein YbgF